MWVGLLYSICTWILTTYTFYTCIQEQNICTCTGRNVRLLCERSLHTNGINDYRPGDPLVGNTIPLVTSMIGFLKALVIQSHYNCYVVWPWILILCMVTILWAVPVMFLILEGLCHAGCYAFCCIPYPYNCCTHIGSRPMQDHIYIYYMWSRDVKRKH